MAKRNTVGGPRQRRLTQADIERREGYLSKAERERIFQQRIIIITSTVSVIIVLIILGAVLNDRYLLPRRDISTVNGEVISINDFQHRVQYSRFQIAEQIRTFYNLILESGAEADQAQSQALQLM